MSRLLNITNVDINFIEILTDDLLLKCGQELGLYHGKMGICMIYYLLSDISKEERFAAKARAILDELSDEISNIQQFDFSSGLAGIGWGIEWLAQNEYIDTDTNEVLEDMDDELYKSVVFTKDSNILLDNGTLGKALYFYRRFLSQNAESVRYRTLCNQECLVLLTDEVSDYLLDKDHGLVQELKESITSPYHLVSLAQSMIFFSKLIPHRINIELLEKNLVAIIELIPKIGIKAKEGDADWLQAYRFLLYTYHLTAVRLQSDDMISGALELINPFVEEKRTSLSNNMYCEYIHFKHMTLLSPRDTLDANSCSVHWPLSVFDILSLCCIKYNIQQDSWSEAWLLS